MAAKVCPLMMVAAVLKPEVLRWALRRDALGSCLEGQCEWWIELESCCVLRLIGEVLHGRASHA